MKKLKRTQPKGHSHHKQKILLNPIVLVAVFALIGVASLFLARAASSSVSVEPEVSAPANLVSSDATASGGLAIRFGTSGGSGTCVNDPIGQFIRKVDVGPQACTYGHKPAGTLKQWTGSSTIADGQSGVPARGSDGWIRIKGYEFKGPLLIAASNVEISDCKVTTAHNGSHKQGAIYTRTSNIPSDFIIDHCHIDQGPQGWSNAGIEGYGKFTVRYSLITGSGDGIKMGSNGLAERNYIMVSGQGTENSPGHIDGVHGEYFKFNWTARHNTIIGGIGQAPNGGSFRPEAGGNICVWAPDTPTGSQGYSGAEGVVAENNYCDGFNAGVALMGTNPNNPSIAKNNYFGANFRYYPGLWVRTYDKGRTGDSPGSTKYVNHYDNIGDSILNEDTGNVSPYKDSYSPIPSFYGAP